MPRHPLARHLFVLIVIKIGLIVAIYHAFFAGHQVDPTSDNVADHLLATPASPPSPSHRSPDHAD